MRQILNKAFHASGTFVAVIGCANEPAVLPVAGQVQGRVLGVRGLKGATRVRPISPVATRNQIPMSVSSVTMPPGPGRCPRGAVLLFAQENRL